MIMEEDRRADESCAHAVTDTLHGGELVEEEWSDEAPPVLPTESAAPAEDEAMPPPEPDEESLGARVPLPGLDEGAPFGFSSGGRL